VHKLFAEYVDKILTLWSADERAPLDGFDRVPFIGHLPEDMPPNLQVLVLGLNPSFSVESLKRSWDVVRKTCSPIGEATVLELLSWPLPENQGKRDAAKLAIETLDRYSRKNHAIFYRPIERLMNAAGLESDKWLHMDLFPIRETSQRRLEAELKFPKRHERERFATLPQNAAYRKARTMHPALRSTLDETLQLICALKPPIVVVLNSFASKLLEYCLDLRLQPNGHRYRSDATDGTCWILSSQLSGGATSLYGMERLLADLRDAVRGNRGLVGGAATEAERAAEAEAIADAETDWDKFTSDETQASTRS